MSNIPILFIRFEGPLQSWGEHSKWDYRDTSDFPTKSGVTGLLACALGWERGDERIEKLCSELSIAVRADRRGTVACDFHTVTQDVLLNAKRAKRNGGNTIVSKRYYLEDASFLVAITGNESTLKECKEALDSPKWQIYLGRKSCVPSYPVIGEISYDYSSLLDAIRKHTLASRHDDMLLMQYEVDGPSYIQKNDIIARSSKREFLSRNVKIGRIAAEGVKKCI